VPPTVGPGLRLGPYEVTEAIAHGGTGAVYKALDRGLGRLVAIKVLHPEFLKDESFAERFRGEAALWGRLDHPRIVPIYTADIENEIPFLAMKFIPGGTLADRLRLGPLALPHAVAILADVASALDYAHGLGIVHRDVKPANVLLDGDGRAYLSDFGIARAAGEGKPLTLSGGVYGTPGYMAPEQARNQNPDYRVDIYSLGCLAYEALTGAAPFQGRNPVEILMRHITEEPTPPRGITPSLPQEVNDAIMKALARDPADRWPTAGLFLEALLGPVQLDSMDTLSIPGRPRPEERIKVAPSARLPYVLFGILVLVAVGAFLLRAFARAPAAVAVAPIPSAAPASPRGPELQAVISGAKRALDDGAYEEALQMSDLALHLEPADPEAQALRDRVVRAWDAEKTLGVWEPPSPSPEAAVDRNASPR
jgi:serine/threonine protein kinase